MLDNFLFAYRSTPSTVTGKTTSELFLGRQIRSRLDILKPCTDVPHNDTLLTKRMTNYNKQMELRVKGRQPVRYFHQGDHVLVRNHVGKRRWMPGVIARNVAHRTYIVNIGNRHGKRHIDDIRLFRGGDTGATIENNNEIDQSLMYGSTNIEHRNISQPLHVEERRYPLRDRRPVERYGISNSNN